jgi:hypothetical protein
MDRKQGFAHFLQSPHTGSMRQAADQLAWWSACLCWLRLSYVQDSPVESLKVLCLLVGT